MSEEARRFRLGLFVIVGLALLLAGILWLGAGRFFEKTHPLYCYFQESVQGLEPGSPVKFRGVQVGRVEAINVMPGARIASATDTPHAASLIEVRCDLFVDKIADKGGVTESDERIDASIAREVAQGLRVRIVWKDITGQKFLDLDYHDPERAPATPPPFDPPGTWIPTAPERSIVDIQRDVAAVASNLAEVDFQAIATDVRAVLASVRARSDELSEARVGEKFADAAEAIAARARDERIDVLTDRAIASLGRIESVASRLDDLLARPSIAAGLDDLADAAASMKRVTATVETEIPRLTQSLQETLDAARAAIDAAKLPETTAAAREAMADAGTASRQVVALRDAARRTLADLSQASRGVAALVRYLEENPAALLRGRTGAER